MQIRDRIRELRRVPASELRPSPRNWRGHPQGQRDAMRGVLAEIGYADAVLARELEDGALELIDGHLRAEEVGESEIPVLVLDVDEEEAAKILATHDPLAAMAEANQESLDELLKTVETENEAVREMLDSLVAGDAFNVDESDAPELPSGDREPFQQMTFTLHDDQASVVKSAIEAAKGAGPFVDTGNKNSNGNALARIAEGYIGQG